MILDNGLIFQWKFNESSGSISPENINGFNGSNINNPTWTSGKLNNCLQLELASNQYVDIDITSSFLKTQQDGSISCWFNRSTNAVSQTIFCLSNFNSANSLFNLVLSANSVASFAQNEGVFSFLFTGPIGAYELNEWNLYTITTQDGYIAHYLNAAPLDMLNVLPGSFPIPSPYWFDTIKNADSCRIGCQAVSGANTAFFDGKVDDFRIFNRSLTLNEIQNLYNNGKGTEDPYGTGSVIKHVINARLNKNITVGTTSLLTARGDSNNPLPNNAALLAVSYADKSTTFRDNTKFNKVAYIGGIPLSVSQFRNTNDNPSASDYKQYYAFDVIEYSATEDTDATSFPRGVNVANSPYAKTFTWNGNRLSSSQINNRYYWDILDVGTPIKNEQTFMLFGMPMAKGNYDELIMNKTDYTFGDISLNYERDTSAGDLDLVNVMIGGTPLTAGRIGNKYYLIVVSKSYWDYWAFDPDLT
jgi:hypothetical protein